ncbi:hypothetical protein THIOKS11100014 [Thiocapsa sp. KS1]|nr:hypothetical protein THIOKS11100014 [Thiocapsa sp. KS1]
MPCFLHWHAASEVDMLIKSAGPYRIFNQSEIFHWRIANQS